MHDLIVIGGGSAGCALAGRLSEDGRLRVLLLEAGDTDQNLSSRIPALMATVVQNPKFDWCYKADPDPSLGGRADVWPGGRRLGGSSAINGMMFIRGHAWDYDHWVELGARGWSHAEVVPFFRRLETNERGADGFRGASGPQSVSDGRARWQITDEWITAAQQAGFPRARDLNGELAEGVDYVQVSQRNGLRHSTAAAYLRDRTGVAKPEVRLCAQVTRILIEQGRAVGVEYLQNGVRQEVRSARGVVVACGAMASPRLLMLSGIGPGAALAAHGITVLRDLPGVGRNLQDHVGTHLVNNVNIPTMNTAVRGLSALGQLLKFVLRRQGALTTSIGHAHVMVASRPGLPAPNLQIIFAPFAFDLDEQQKLVLRPKPAISQAICVVRPKARGSVELRSADPLALPRIRYERLAHDDDLNQLVEGVELARRIVSQPALARYIVDEARPGPLPDAEALRGYCRMAAIPMYHAVGTCRMGVDEQAVVDPDLAVRGLEGLWVADASVMPSLTAGNTNATSIMIGDKGAAHILKTLGLTKTVLA